MDRVEVKIDENAMVISQEISTLIEDIEKKVTFSNMRGKECKELNILKEKCCSNNVMVSLTSFQAINKLVEKKVLVGSQTISTLVSLLPSVIHYNALISTVGNILILDLKDQLTKNKTYQSLYDKGEIQHPFIMILKFNGNKSWFEVYSFIYNLMQCYQDIKLKYKINLIRPVFHYIFWNPTWKGSQFQLKLFNFLMLKINVIELLTFSMEVTSWQDMDIQYCMYLQDIFIHLLSSSSNNNKLMVSALAPTLAEAIKWLILNGCNPTCWINLLSSSIQTDDAALSVILYILADVIMETPSLYLNDVVNICKSIICSASCNVYIAHKFMAMALSWFINPSSLAYPVYKTLEEILLFLRENADNWNDQTFRLINNEYFQIYGSNNDNIKFAVDMITLSNSWNDKLELTVEWLINLKESAEPKMQVKLHSFIYSIILHESDKTVIDLCLEILFQAIDSNKNISPSSLWVLFYKLARETNPGMQKTYLLALPKLAVKKENVPLIIRIIESLRGGHSKIMTPLVIQLFLTLWKLDNRTYSHLHKALYENSHEDAGLELNTSKAIALREICRLASHLHGKNVINVLSRVLNESADIPCGLPLAITIEAIIELCKAYVIDVSGIWYAIQPKLSTDNRPKILMALCKFFGEIPKLNSSEKKYDQLIGKVVPMLWNYTFSDNAEVVKSAFQALSKFEIENLEPKLLPESYRPDLRLSEQSSHKKLTSDVEDALPLSYVPPESWLLFLEKIRDSYLEEGGALLITMMERELNSLPRGVFYLPPEKSEPPNYSYLPQKSICRVFVDRLRKYSKMDDVDDLPIYLKQIIRILSHEYSKILPPLDWYFMSHFFNLDSEYLHYTLALLAKQGSTSKSAKSMLENYLTTVKWNDEKLEDIVFLYGKIHQICKAVSFNVLQNFCRTTINLCVETSLKTGGDHFERILENLTKALKNENVKPEYKTMMSKNLESVLQMIPPEHKLMKNYASCAKEFPLKSIDNITLNDSSSKTPSDWLHRAIIIRCSCAMRSDVTNPLMWLSGLTEAAAVVPEKQSFFLSKVSSIIRNSRSSNHTTWLQELMWKTQTSITNSERDEESLFLIDIFVTAVIVLTGCDCLFTNTKEISQNAQKKLEIFPRAFNLLVDFPEWSSSLPKLSLWLEKLLKWKHLPKIYVESFAKSMLIFTNLDDRTRADLLNIVLRNI